MPTVTPPHATQFSGQYDAGCGSFLPFEAICEPGSYICNWSGHLLRVPPDGVVQGRSPLITFVGCDPLFVTKLSHDPYIPVTKARLLAANCNTCVNF